MPEDRYKKTHRERRLHRHDDDVAPYEPTFWVKRGLTCERCLREIPKGSLAQMYVVDGHKKYKHARLTECGPYITFGRQKEREEGQ